MSTPTVPCPECNGPGSNCMRCEGEGFVETSDVPFDELPTVRLRHVASDAELEELADWQRKDFADHDLAICDCSGCDNARRAEASHHPENS